jgi:NAD(P)-dependent dehydrogenase (short-subunit alcohol dehydrogenase family)
MTEPQVTQVPTAATSAMIPRAHYNTISLVLSAAAVLLYVVRISEIIPLMLDSIYTILVPIVPIVLLSLFFVPPKSQKDQFQRLLCTVVALYSIKSEIDVSVGNRVDRRLKDLEGSVCIVTGANRGIGYETTKYLYKHNATVIMACRDMQKCEEAKNSIMEDSRPDAEAVHGPNGTLPGSSRQLVPMILDMSDLDSVRSFAESFKNKYEYLDNLILNAGAVSHSGKRTKQGLEDSIGTMHIGNAALVRWLQAPLTAIPENIRFRDVNGVHVSEPSHVVVVSSFWWHSGAFHSSLYDGSGAGDFWGELTDNCGQPGDWRCPMGKSDKSQTNGYNRAKLANVLWAHEFQRHIDTSAAALAQQEETTAPKMRRVMTSAVQPGAVLTDTLSDMVGMNDWRWLLEIILRPAETAAKVVVTGLAYDDYVPGSYIDAMGFTHDLLEYRKSHMAGHRSAFPDAPEYHPTIETVTAKDRFKHQIDEWIFSNHVQFCWNCSEKVCPTVLSM